MTDIFISYSHQDEQWKEALQKQLQVLLHADFTVWDDRQIKPGDGWLDDIEASIAAAKVAILLISPDFLISEFVRRQEIPKFLARRSEDGLRVIPLVVEPCPWQVVDWLASMQGATKDNAPLSRYAWDSYELKHELSQVALKVFYQLNDVRAEEAARLEAKLAEEAERQRQADEQNRQEQLALEQAAEKQRAEQQRLKEEAEKAERLDREEKQRLKEVAETNARKAEEEQARLVEQQRQDEEAERLRQKQVAADKLQREQEARKAQELQRKREAEDQLRQEQAEREGRELAERQKAELLRKQREAEERKAKIKGTVLASVSSGKGLTVAGVGLAAVVAGWVLSQESPVVEEKVIGSAAVIKQPVLVVAELPAVEVKRDEYALTLHTIPADANIKLPDIVPRYSEGMLLKPDKYRVEVTANGYEMAEVTVDLSESDQVQTITLKKQEKLSYEPDMVSIEGGTFTMGCVEGRDDVVGGCDSDEKPAHEVTVKAFKLAKTEVTVEQFREFAEQEGYKTTAEEKGSCWGDKTGKGDWAYIDGNNWRKPGFDQTDQHPVTCVSWGDTQAYIEWLSKQSGNVYRLPTEAEWEYAARGKSNEHAYFWGQNPDEGCDFANMADLTAKKKYSNWSVAACDDGYTHTAPVKSFKANAYGLYDMSGNLWEWTDDIYGDYKPGQAPASASPDAARVLRGGSWFNTPGDMRAAYRSRYSPGFRDLNVGFRLAQGQSNK